MITTKLYYENDLENIDGYTLYLTDTGCFSPENQKLPNYCINYTYFGKLADSNFCGTNSATVPQGKSVFMFPNCPYALNDIRAHYTIKRDADTGDCNVFVPAKNWKTHRLIYCLLAWPQKRIAIGSMGGSTEKDILNLARAMFPDMSESELSLYIAHNNSFYVFWLNDPKELYRKALDGDFKKPLVSMNQLDITNSNKLTLDVLQLVYHTVKKNESYDDIITQLEMLNQYDWRKYPGTMFIFSILLSKHSKFYRMRKRSSNYNKVVQAFLKIQYTTCTTKEDIELAQSLLYYIMGFDGTIFVSFSNLRHKLDDAGLTPQIFESAFNSIVRVSPKKIEEESSNEELE